jgi:hypothetical protein
VYLSLNRMADLLEYHQPQGGCQMGKRIFSRWEPPERNRLIPHGNTQHDGKLINRISRRDGGIFAVGNLGGMTDGWIERIAAARLLEDSHNKVPCRFPEVQENSKSSLEDSTPGTVLNSGLSL